MSVLDLLIRTRAMEAIGSALIHSLWEGVIAAALLAAVLIWVRSPRIRHSAASVALVAIFAGFVITLIHCFPENRRSAGTSMNVILAPLGSWSDASGSSRRFLELNAFSPWLPLVWIVGVCLSYLRYAAGWLSLHRMRRWGARTPPGFWQQSLARLAAQVKVSRPVEMLESLLVDAPVVLGHLRPVILVPLGFLAGLSTDQVEAILLHELAHIRRSDYFLNAFQRLVEGLLFYHPAVWWISHVIRVERENCCDDMVVSLRGHVHNYAVALAALEQNRVERAWAAPDTGIAGTGGNLMKRIQRLLYPPKDPSGFWAPALASVVLVASASMLLAAWHTSPDSGLTSQQTVNRAESPWETWLTEGVPYIVTDQERTAFNRLKTDEERQHFVEAFWARRNPKPGAAENEFKKEYYRRIAYATQHYQAGSLPGWRTDRGRIYITYGPPDEIEAHPRRGVYTRPAWEGGGTAVACPFEDWRYPHFQGVGSLVIEFVDPSSSGQYRVTLDPKQEYKEQ
jgi:GWxTD domain-containing protein